MSHRWWIVILGIAILITIMMRRTPRSQESYTTFTSQRLGVRFDYPKGWRVKEITTPSGHVVGEVQIFGPRREDLGYSLYVDVSAESLSGGQLSHSLDEIVNQWQAIRKQQPSYAILEEARLRCGGEPAGRVVAQYELALPLKAVNRKVIMLKEATAFCLHHGYFFRLSFAAPAEDFVRYQHAFTRLVNSLRFL